MNGFIRANINRSYDFIDSAAAFITAVQDSSIHAILGNKDGNRKWHILHSV